VKRLHNFFTPRALGASIWFIWSVWSVLIVGSVRSVENVMNVYNAGTFITLLMNISRKQRTEIRDHPSPPRLRRAKEIVIGDVAT